MKTLELEPSLDGTKLTFDLPPDVAAAIAEHPGLKLRIEVPGPGGVLPPVPKPGDGVEAWRRYREACGSLSGGFERPPQDGHLDGPPADLSGIA